MADFSWVFSEKKKLLFRVEILLVSFLALLIILLTLSEERWFLPIIYALVFVGIYTVISYLLKNIRKVEHAYTFSKKHLEITHTKDKKKFTEKVPLEQIKRHKLDRLLLGGYVLTKKGKKYVLYFNNKKELDKFKDKMIDHGIF